MFKLGLTATILAAMLVLGGCGANAGRCGLTSPGYPLCGI